MAFGKWSIFQNGIYFFRSQEHSHKPKYRYLFLLYVYIYIYIYIWERDSRIFARALLLNLGCSAIYSSSCITTPLKCAATRFSDSSSTLSLSHTHSPRHLLQSMYIHAEYNWVKEYNDILYIYIHKMFNLLEIAEVAPWKRISELSWYHWESIANSVCEENALAIKVLDIPAQNRFGQCQRFATVFSRDDGWGHTIKGLLIGLEHVEYNG